MLSGDPKVLEEGSAVNKRLELQRSRVEVLDVLVRKDGESKFAAARRMIASAKKGEYDVVTAQDPFFLGLIAWKISRKTRTTLQLQLHTDIFAGGFWRKNFVKYCLARFLLPRAGSVRVVSESLKQKLLDRTSVSKISVLPIFIDKEKVLAAPTVDLKAQYPQFSEFILVASRLEKEKRIDVALHVFKEIVATLPKTGLLVAGSGSQKESLERLSHELGIAKHVVFLGHRDDIYSLYKSVDLLLSPSASYEGYGASIVEALAAGCPVVALDAGIAKEAGATVAPREGLAAAAIEVLKHHNEGHLKLSLPTKEEYARAWKHALPQAQFSFWRIWTPWVVFGAIIIALLLRIQGIIYGLPLDVVGDEFVHVITAFSFFTNGTLRATEVASYVPSLMAIIVAPFFALFGVLGVLTHHFANLGAFKEFVVVNSEEFMIGPRVVSALFGTAFVFVFYRFVRHLLGLRAGLFAALLATFDFWLVHESSFAHFWMPMTFFVTLSAYALVRLRERPTVRKSVYAATSLVFGYWAGYIAIVMLPWFLFAQISVLRAKSKVLLIGGAVLVLFLAFVSWLNPVSFIWQFGRSMHAALSLVGISAFNHLPKTLPSGPLDPLGNMLTFGRVLFFDNPIVFVLGVVGLFLFAYKKGLWSFATSLMLGFPILYTVLGSFIWVGPEYRYILPVLPFVLFGAVVAVEMCIEWALCKRTHALKFVSYTVFFVVVAYSAVASAHFALLLRVPDTRLQAISWFTSHIPTGSSVIIDGRYLLLPRNRAALAYLVQHNLADSLRSRDYYLLSQPDSAFPTPSYAAFSEGEAQQLGLSGPDYLIREWYMQVSVSPVPAGYTLIESFVPRAGSEPIDELLQNPVNPFSAVLKVSNLGPYVEIYRRVQ
jgi:glycosyltransferase involved in cell wall biosynthesis